MGLSQAQHTAADGQEWALGSRQVWSDQSGLGEGQQGLDPLYNATVAGHLRPQHLECGPSGQKAETL